MTNYSFVKDPGDKMDCGFDWTTWLSSDTITASTWTLPTGITQFSATNTTTTTTLWVTGGTHGSDYLVTNQITTAAGRIKQLSIKIMVRES